MPQTIKTPPEAEGSDGATLEIAVQVEDSDTTTRPVAQKTTTRRRRASTQGNSPDGDDDDRKPAALETTQFWYYAVCKCDGLRAPAIFLTKEDCSFYIDEEENDSPAQYEVFASLDEAKEHIQRFIDTADIPAGGNGHRVSKVATNSRKRAPAAASPRPRKARKTSLSAKISTASKANERPTTPQKQAWLDSFDEKVQLAEEYKAKHGNCDFPQDSRLLIWLKQVRRYSQPQARGGPSFLKQRLSVQQAEKLADLGIVKSQEEQKLEKKIERQEKRLEKQKEYLDATWDEMINQLHEYKTETGREDVPLTVSGPEKEKYGELMRWLQKIRKHMKDYAEGLPELSPMTEEQIAEMTRMGVLISRGEKDKKTFEETWPQMIAQLEKFKLEYGHCEVPLRTDRDDFEDYSELSRWVTRLRSQMKSYEENPETSHLDEHKITELQAIGFSFKYRRGMKAKSRQAEQEDFETYLELLRQTVAEKKALKTNIRLQAWVAKQRKEYEEFKNNRPSTMDITRVTQLTEAGFVFQAKKTQSWDERALNWFQFKTKNGCDPKRYSPDGLGKWVTEQRRKYILFQQGERTNLTQEQIDKLTAWGFSFELKIRQPAVRTPRASWDERFEQLLAWKEEHGHCMVPQMFPALGQWVHGQRSEYRKMRKGMKSPMTQEKVQKLEAIGFVFYTGKGGGVRTPDSVARRLNQATELEPDPFGHPTIDPHLMHYYR